MKIITLIPDRKKLTTKVEQEKEIKRFIRENILDDGEARVLVYDPGEKSVYVK